MHITLNWSLFLQPVASCAETFYVQAAQLNSALLSVCSAKTSQILSTVDHIM